MALFPDYLQADKVNDPFWHYVGLVLLTFMTAVNGRIGQFGSFPMVVYKLPCTILHELAHLLVGFLTGGHPGGLSLIPRREIVGDRIVWRLGSVTLKNPGFLSCFPTAFAPLLYIPVTYLAYLRWPAWFPASPAWTVAMYLAIGIMLGSAVPSDADVRVAFSSFRGNIFYLALILACILIALLGRQ